MAIAMRCLELAEFDMNAFISAGHGLSIVSFLWQPPGYVTYRLDQHSPVTQNWAAVSALNSWAERTDPGSRKRSAYYLKKWYSRPFGQNMVVFDENNYSDHLVTCP